MRLKLPGAKAIGMALSIVFFVCEIPKAEKSAQTKLFRTPASTSTIRQLSEVLQDLEKHYKVNILFNDQQVEGVSIRHELLNYAAGIEHNLQKILSETGLKYRKARGNSFLITGRRSEKKPVKGELMDMNLPFPMLAGVAPQLIVDKNVRGSVKDEKGEPLPGVSILIKGTQQGTVTGVDGAFALDVPDDNAILILSFVGYIPQEVMVGSRSTVEVSLKVDEKALEEVVVVGYGTQSRETLTTSVSKLDNRVLENVPYANAATAMQGTLAGVRVQTTTGQPGATPRVIVRGGTSINNPNGATPLYIIDGVIRSDMDHLNADDIASIQVLKDAASTSIYGARGSNGVVVITTKSGKSGAATISYKYNVMSSSPWKVYDLIPARDFIKFYRMGVMATAQKLPARMSLLTDASPGGTGNDLTERTTYTTQYLSPANQHKLNEGWESMPDPLDPSKTIIFQDTDWQKVLYRTGISHNHSMNFSGGTDRATFNLGMGYLNNNGMAYGSDYKRISLNLNSDFKIRDNLKAFGRILYSKSFHRGDEWLYDRVQAIAPTQKLYLEDGVTLAPAGRASPRYYENSQDVRNQKENLSLTLGANWELLPGLAFEPQVSIYKFSVNNRFFQKAAYLAGPAGAFTESRVARGLRSELIQYQADAVMSYFKSIDNRHNISAKGGFAYFMRENNQMSAQGQGAASDQIPTLNASSTPVAVSSLESFQLILGYFARVNYDYKEKYLFSLNARYDGASSLGDAYKWGMFPGVSVGWNVHKESFWTKAPSFLSQLKVRSSYGVNGNISGLTDYQAQGEYGVGARYGGNPATVNTILANPNLQWERSKTLDFGIDLGFLGNRVRLISDIYHKVTDNLLTSLPLPASTGFGSVSTNLGSLQNRGVEIEITAQLLPAKSTFQWDVSLNAAKVTNKILRLPNNGVERNRVGGYYVWDPKQNGYAWLGGLQEGGKLGEIFGYIQKGIFRTDEEAAQAPVDMIITLPDRTKFGGDVDWADLDNNNIIDTRDRAYMGNMFPTWTGGLSSYLSYKNISLAVRGDYMVGHTKHNWSRALILSQYGTTSGIVSDVYRSWQKPGDVTDVPRYYWGEQTVHRNIGRENATLNGGNSKFYERGDFLALREVTISYTLPRALSRKARISNANVYFTGNNLHYFTKYRGLSPEDGGMDLGGYPPPRNLILGVNLSF